MKELSIEQKAKRYDEALGRIKSWVRGEHPECFTEAQKAAEFIFPELKESEDDRIRKAILGLVMQSSEILGNQNQSNMITWLEKQGYYTKKDVDDAYLKGISDAKNEIEKQYEANYQIRKDIATFIFNYRGDLKDRAKWMDYLGIRVSFVKNQDKKNPQPSLILKSALEVAKEEKVDNQNCVKPDKNEPEFHEGEWVVYNHDICQIVKREEGCNKLVTVFGIEKELVNERNLSTAHLWTIEDAKDGDVLICEDGYPFIYASNHIYSKYLTAYCGITNDGVFKNSDKTELWTNDNVVPATKEQRDLLFSKMKEAGYEWNASKKELKKIENAPENYKQQLMSEITDLVEDYISQKPTWSEEDEKKLSDIISILGSGENCFYNSPILIDWLKSLKERIGG